MNLIDTAILSIWCVNYHCNINEINNYPGEQSKLLVLSSASFFSCLCCFDFSYPLYSAQVSLDFATLCRQTDGRLALQQSETRITQKIFKCELNIKTLQIQDQTAEYQ